MAEEGRLAFGTVDTFLLWRLTDGAVHATDVSNASRTMLFNLTTLSWDPWLLDHMGIPPSLLPDVRGSSQLLGKTVPESLGASIPVAGIAGDQQAALFGQSCFRPGMAKNTYGTGCFLLSTPGPSDTLGERPADHGRLAAGRFLGGPTCPVTFALEEASSSPAPLSSGCAMVLGILSDSAEVEALALPSRIAVVWPSSRRWSGWGALLGPVCAVDPSSLTRIDAPIWRATLEAIAFQTRDVLGDAERRRSLFAGPRCDGGAAGNNLLLQFQADVLGTPVQRPAHRETTALGAAMLAGLATGVWSSVDDLDQVWTLERQFDPTMSQDERDQRYGRWQEAVRRSRAWAGPAAKA
jgi:glycerol kinase